LKSLLRGLRCAELYFDVGEDDPLDEAQLAARVKQASLLPDERV
jgi:hypothetical protein